MTEQDHWALLRRSTQRAQDRYDRARVEIERRGDHTPRPGDLLGFVETAEHCVLWVVLERDSSRQPQRFLLAAADLHPFIGSRDVAMSPDSACGALSLRCGFSLWLEARELDSAQNIGTLGAKGLAQVHRKWHQVEDHSISRSLRDHESQRVRDTDSDPVYLDWLQEGPEQALATLLNGVGRSPE